MVEWKKIEELSSSVFAGGTPSTNHDEYYDGDIPWIRSGEIDFNVITSAERNITEEGYNNSSAKLIRKGSVVMAMTGATVAKSAIVNIETTANQSVCAIETDESIANYKYVYYSLAKDYFKIKSSAQGALTSLNLTMIKQIEIPVPSISEQNRIVGILDTFTSSIENLKEQLTLRRKQFEHYREKLLSLDGVEGVEWKALGEIATFTYGYTDKAQDDGTARFIRITDITDDGVLNPNDAKYIELTSESKKFQVKKGDLLMARTGATFAKTLYVPNDDIAVYASFLIKIDLDSSKLLNRYYWYFTKSNNYWNQANALASKAGQPQFNSNALCRVKIHIPPLAVQQSIVEKLDKFTALIENIEQELELRQKQYEHYREQLLTFE